MIEFFQDLVLGHTLISLSTKIHSTQEKLGYLLKGIQDRTVLHIFDCLILHYFLQLIFRLTQLTTAAKSNQKLINQKLFNTVVILDALLLGKIAIFQTTLPRYNCMPYFTKK